MEKLITKVELDVEYNDYKKKNKVNKNYFIMWTLIIIFFILSIWTKLVFLKTEKGRKKNNIIYAEVSTIGNIVCTYNIQDIKQTTKIFGNKFEIKSLFDFYIDDKKVQFSKDIKFNSLKDIKWK